jgi:hypothetical protein
MWSPRWRCSSPRRSGLTSPGLLLALTAVQATGVRGQLADPRRHHSPSGPTHEVAAANALGTTSFGLAMAAGPLVAGLLVARGQFALAYLVDAVAVHGRAVGHVAPADPAAAADRGR